MPSARGAAARRVRYALLLIDFFNPDGFHKRPGLARQAVIAAKHTAALKTRLGTRAQCIYVNDNFGNWQADFASVVAQCAERAGTSAQIAHVLDPQPGDWSVLKPRHSAFYGTPLEFMLDELGVKTCILAGLLTDACISVTAYDAHIRRYEAWVPANCVAANTAAQSRLALAQLRRAAKADTTASTADLRSIKATPPANRR